MPAGAKIFVNHLPDSTLPQPGAVDVYECVGRPTEYRLHYTIDIAEGDLPLLSQPQFDPDTVLSVMAEVRGEQHCLVKGPVFGQSSKIMHGGEGSELEVIGGDTRIRMDRESKVVVTPAGSASAAVEQILTSYGLQPQVDPTDGAYSVEKHSLVQRETDYEFVMRIAQENGFLFWITTDPLGVETAYFKRPPLSGEAAAELTINQPRATLRSLVIEWDVQTAVSTSIRQMDLTDGGLIDGSLGQSALPPLGNAPLASILTAPSVRHLAAPVDDVGGAQGLSAGLLLESTFFVKARAVSSTTAMGKLIRPFTLVNLVGAGVRHDGTWFCTGVWHKINDNEHAMEIDLARNAWSQ